MVSSVRYMVFSVMPTLFVSRLQILLWSVGYIGKNLLLCMKAIVRCGFN